MGGAFEELRATGSAGERTVAAMQRLARQVTRSRSFPPPEGYSSWSDEAVNDFLAELFASKGQALVLQCYLKATNEASLERLLLTAIGRFLIDQAKGTERGKLRRRLDGLLDADPRFVRVPEGQPGAGWWMLVGGVPDPWQGDWVDLEKAAFAIRGVAVTRWNTAGPTPRLVKQALLSVAHGALRAAMGSVNAAVLTRVVEARFALLAPPILRELDADESFDPPTETGDVPGSDLLVRQRAAEVYETLTARERALLPHLGAEIETQMQVLELGQSQTRVITERLAEKIRLATHDDEDREDIARDLLRLCAAQP